MTNNEILSLVIEPFSDKAYLNWITSKTYPDDPDFIQHLVKIKQDSIRSSYMEEISAVKTALLNQHITKEKFERLNKRLSVLERNIEELKAQW